MGVIRSNAVMYLEARRRGANFTRTLTLGRLRLYMQPAEIDKLSAEFRPDLGERGKFAYGQPADDFLKAFLGIQELQCLDHSRYEGAGLVHDLNLPVAEALEQQYDAVIDSGTLEHVFNLPVALANCMRMVKRGGTLFLSAPANNMCGHGFYQFSPELFFRLFRPENGFELKRLVLVKHPFPGAELSSRQTWYEVSDPETLGERAAFMTAVPVEIMVEATRIEVVPPLLTAPQQSDYTRRWSAEADSRPGRRGWARAAYRRLPPRVQATAVGWYQRLFTCTLRNRRAFRRV